MIKATHKAVYGGTSKYDMGGLTNEHSDNGGHTVWVKDDDGNLVARMVEGAIVRNCEECGTVYEPKAKVKDGKRGVCRVPASLDNPRGRKRLGVVSTCVNCGGRLVGTFDTQAGWEHRKVGTGLNVVDAKQAAKVSKAQKVRDALTAGGTLVEISKDADLDVTYAYAWDVLAAMIKKGNIDPQAARKAAAK